MMISKIKKASPIFPKKERKDTNTKNKTATKSSLNFESMLQTEIQKLKRE